MYSPEQFSSLIKNIDDLELALKQDSLLINAQDETGMTLLHHAASLGLKANFQRIKPILDTLFLHQSIDLSIKDNRGDTALHTAAWLCKDLVTCTQIFPYLVKKTKQYHFDFSTQGHDDAPVLHIAASTSYSEQYTLNEYINNAQTILDNIPHCDINHLSGSGAPALTYALNADLPYFFINAMYLLEKGANPLVGVIGERPIDKIPEMITCINKKKSIPTHYKNRLINDVNTLGKRMNAQSLLNILQTYKQTREEDNRHYFNMFSIFGGYSKVEKLRAVNVLITAINENFSVSDDVLAICQQGRLGHVIAQWEQDTGTTIKALVNNFSDSFTHSNY